MCGRYFQQRGTAELARYFETVNPLPNTAPSFNRAPTQDALVIRRHPESGARHLDPLRWGLVPRWAKDASGAARMINARSETLAEKPAFREAFGKRRCLVTADGFFEWRQEGRDKQPFAVALADGAPMALAGLWEGWRAPDGSILRSCGSIISRGSSIAAGSATLLPSLAGAHAASPENSDSDCAPHRSLTRIFLQCLTCLLY